MKKKLFIILTCLFTVVIFIMLIKPTDETNENKNTITHSGAMFENNVELRILAPDFFNSNYLLIEISYLGNGVGNFEFNDKMVNAELKDDKTDKIIPLEVQFEEKQFSIESGKNLLIPIQIPTEFMGEIKDNHNYSIDIKPNYILNKTTTFNGIVTLKVSK